MKKSVIALAAVVLCSDAAFAWGLGHDTVARCLLRRLPAELSSRMKPEWIPTYLEASHLPDAGSMNILLAVDREPLISLGWTGGLELHDNRLRFAMFNRLVHAIRRDDAYSQFMLLAAISHVNADPAACNHNPVVQCGSYIWGSEGLNVYPKLGLDFASVETTPVMRSVMERRLAAIQEPVLPEKLSYTDCYDRLVRLQWDADELCNGRGSDVMERAAALAAGDASAENGLAEALCDLGMYAVEHTLWFYAAARRLANEKAEPPSGFDAKAFIDSVEKEMSIAFSKRPFGADGYLRPYLPEPGVRYDVLVMADSLANMSEGVLAPSARMLAPQAVGSLRHVRPDLKSALVDIRDVREGKLDPSVTRLLVVFGEKIDSFRDFDGESLKAALVAWSRAGGKVLWVNGVPPVGMADGLVVAMVEPNPNMGGYCDSRYWVPQREIVGTTLAWIGDSPVAYSFLRRPTGMSGWYWEGSHIAFDAARLPSDVERLMTVSSSDVACTVAVAAPKGKPTFAYMPTAAFFPYVLTREVPSPKNFELRFDTAGESFLLRVVNLLLGEGQNGGNPCAAFVNVTRPDHMHAYCAVKALRKGQKVFVPSPAARTVEESRILFAEAAKRPGGLAIGDLGPVSQEDKATVEKVRSFGNVRHVMVSCKTDMSHLGEKRPQGAQSAPESWTDWIGVMPLRPYFRLYEKDEGWRAFLDFGTGPLGKDGARLLRPVFLALGLGAPECAERLSVGGASPDRETYPKAAEVKFRFRDGVEVVWRHGPDVDTAVTWRNERGETLVTKPAKPVSEVDQIAALKCGDAVPPEAETVTETILLGCRAMMTDRRVTVDDCEKRYVRDGWEWLDN